MTPLPAEQLQGLDSAAVIDWSPSDKHWLNEERAGQLATVIRSNTKLRTLKISTDVSDEAAQILAEAIAHHPSIKDFHLARQTLSQESLTLLADAALGLPQLENFQMKAVGMLAPLQKNICAQAAAHPSLHSICLSKNVIAPEALPDIHAMVQNNHHWQRIRLMDCELDTSQISDIATHLGHQPDLCRFHMQHRPDGAAPDSPEKDAIGAALIATQSKNLLSVFPNNAAVSAYCAQNKAENTQLLDEVVTALKCEQAASVAINARVKECLPSLKFLSTGSDRYDDCLTYLHEIPPMKKDGATYDLLAAGNHLQQCAAENPDSWQNPKTLLAQMENHGATIDISWLQQHTPQGESLLLCGITCGRHNFIEALQERGITLNQETLLDENGQQTPEMQALFACGVANAVFCAENWQKAGLQDYRAVASTLTEEQRGQIGNFHRLQSTLSNRERNSITR